MTDSEIVRQALAALRVPYHVETRPRNIVPITTTYPGANIAASSNRVLSRMRPTLIDMFRQYIELHPEGSPDCCQETVELAKAIVNPIEPEVA